MPGNILSLHMHISENVLTHICQHPPPPPQQKGSFQMYYTDFRWYFSKLMFIMHNQLFSIVNYISIHLELHVIAQIKD